MDFIEKTLAEKYGRGTSSFRVGMSCVRAFVKDCYPKLKTVEDIKNDSNLILSSILSCSKAKETQRKLLLVFLSVYKKLDRKLSLQQFGWAYANLKKQIFYQQKQNLPKCTEIDALNLDFGQLRQQYPVDTTDMSQRGLLFNLLIHIDETPRLEYRTLRYNPTQQAIAKQSNLNYIQVSQNACSITLNDYKTKRLYGRWTIPILDGNLRAYVREYSKVNKLHSGDHVFVNTVGKPFPNNKFSEYVQKMFKKKIGMKMSINALRKLKECFLFHQNPVILNMSIAEKEAWVKRYFKHNLATSLLYYNKKPQSMIERRSAEDSIAEDNNDNNTHTEVAQDNVGPESTEQDLDLNSYRAKQPYGENTDFNDDRLDNDPQSSAGGDSGSVISSKPVVNPRMTTKSHSPNKINKNAHHINHINQNTQKYVSRLSKSDKLVQFRQKLSELKKLYQINDQQLHKIVSGNILI